MSTFAEPGDGELVDESGVFRSSRKGRVSLVGDGVSMSATTAQVLTRLQSTFTDESARLGITADVERDPHLRFGAQLAAVFFDGARWRVLVVGDCGVRIDGDGVASSKNVGDAVLAMWRAKVFASVVAGATTAATEAPASLTDAALAVARHYTVAGAERHLQEHATWLPLAEYRRCAAAVERDAHAAFPELPPDLVSDILAYGLIGSARHRNASGPFGSPCIDGSTVPADQAVDMVIDAAGVDSLELFSDGYFGTPPRAAITVTDWEAHFAHVESVDPFKVGAYPSTKGSSSTAFTDDRSVLVLKMDRTERADER